MQKRIILLLLFGITLESINQYSNVPLGNTYMWWVINSATLFFIVKTISKFYDKKNDKNLIFVKLFLVWNVICIIRGFFVASDYWEWKFLIFRIWFLLLPICVFLFTNTYIVQKLIQQWVKFLLPAFFLFVPILQTDAVGRYLMPISLLLVFFPKLKTKWKIIALLVTSIVLLTDLSARSNVIKFIVPLLISLLFYFQSFLGYKFLNLVRRILLMLPIVLFFLALTNVFNIFKMSEYLEGDYTVAAHENSYGEVEDLTADTRTFLYVEEIMSALKYDYVIFGRTPARGYESPHFGKQIDKDLKRKKNERFSSEVSILNIFNWNGLTGVIIYFLIFIRASFLAINKSNNWPIKLLGLYITFRWVYAWVEDYSAFDLSFLFLFVALSMCYSKGFRAMSNSEFKYWLYGIFDVRYRKAIIKVQRVKLR